MCWRYSLGLLLKPHNCTETTELLLKISPCQNPVGWNSDGAGWGTRVDNN
jgi:hypothetical protein